MQAVPTRSRIAIIGGGWAGMATAIALHQQGHQLQIWEAGRIWGGRARALTLHGPQGQRWTVDNGQHILIGAYQTCLQMMRTVGINPNEALLRLPLDLRYADGNGLRLPQCRSPWDAVLGIACATGWSWREKWSLLRCAQRWHRNAFRCPEGATVADICSDLPARVLHEFIDPLCISALNVSAAQACAKVFLRVLQDALFSDHGGSNLLIPRTDLSQLFPASAAQWLHRRGAQLHLGERVQSIQYDQINRKWCVQGQLFDHVVIATACTEAARLVRAINADESGLISATQAWAECAEVLEHTAIATTYAYSASAQHKTQTLSAPIVALRSSANAPAQFAFDKAQTNGPKGVIALVASACDTDVSKLQKQAIAQAKQQLQIDDLQALKTIIDKRATFSCTPNAMRPNMHIAPHLWACADYVEGPYPATLEGAMQCGTAVAKAIRININLTT